MRIPLLSALTAVLLASLSCDELPGVGPVCLAICAPSVGTYHFVNADTGESAEVSGTISIALKDSGSVLFEQPLDAVDTVFTYFASDDELVPYEGGTAMLTVTVRATGFQSYVADVEVSFSRAEICGSSCVQSGDNIDVNLVPE